MIISKKTKHTLKLVKEPSVRISQVGHFVFNKAAVDLLEIEDAAKDGVIFGYDNNEAFVGYSNENDAYKGGFKSGESSFRFGSKYEAEQILSSFNIKEKKACLIVSTDPKDIKVYDGYKLYKFKHQ